MVNTAGGGPPVATPTDTLEASDQISSQLEGAMRKLVVLARLIGWVWMLALVIATLNVDPAADRTIVLAAMALATVWTGVTVWAARSKAILGSGWFVAADTVVALLIGGASWAAGATDLFHGGYLVSTLAVAAYGTNLYGVTIVATLIGVEQAAILLSWGKGPVPALSSLGFVLWGLVFGWLFKTIRDTDAYRRTAVDELVVERERAARNNERLRLANNLHDSALQTLQVIDANSGDPERVRKLARRQTRELRNLVDTYVPAESRSLKTALVRAVSDIEDLFDVEVSAVIRVDIGMDQTLEALVAATTEAMTNSARHSGAGRIDLYAALEDGVIVIYVRDEGRGFDVKHYEKGHGLQHSVLGRVEAVDGELLIVSAEGEGTEIRLSAPPREVVS